MFIKITLSFLASILALSSAAEVTLLSKANFTKNVKESTQNLGGINCLVNAVFNVEDTANNFMYNIQLCKLEEQPQIISHLVENCELLNSKTNIVINADDHICRNAAYNESTDAYKVPPALCGRTIRQGMSKVYNMVYKTFQLLNIESAFIDDPCSQMAATKLKLNLPVFTELVQNCPKIFEEYDDNYDYY